MADTLLAIDVVLLICIASQVRSSKYMFSLKYFQHTMGSLGYSFIVNEGACMLE